MFNAKSVKLSAEARQALLDCRVDGFTVTLAGQLDRRVYEEVNEALRRCGGAWSRKEGWHVFPWDPGPLVAALQATGEMPPRNPTSFFPTPKALVIEMCNRAGLHAGSRLAVLEPSAGLGDIALEVRERCPHATIQCVEIMPTAVRALRDMGLAVIEGDFLSAPVPEGFDVVLMNPPFSAVGSPRVYQQHIRWAFTRLKPTGVLVAIAPPTFATSDRHQDREFRDWVCEYGGWEELGPGLFRDTTVATVLIEMRPSHAAAMRQPVDGYHCRHCSEAALTLENDAATYRALVAAVQSGALDAFARAVLGGVRTLGAQVALTRDCIAHLWEHYRETHAETPADTPSFALTGEPA